MTAQTGSASALEQARAYVGAPCGPLRVGRDPVNLPMVHHWCQALDDRNPAYLDEDFAARTRGHLIAPPGMLQTWTMDAPRDPSAMSPNDHVVKLLDEAGYTSVVAVNYEHEYVRELQHGERLSVRSTTEDLSEEKKTALGVGVFTTTRSEYVTDDGELVGIGRMRLLKFRPPNKQHDVGVRPKPPVGRDNAFFWEGVSDFELRIQECNGCGMLRHPPAPLCDRCGSSDQGYVVSSGRGVVYSHVTHHYPPLPGVERPHVVLLVELDEGVRIVSELAEPAEVRIGMPVEVAFTKVPGGDYRPTFRVLSEVPA
ncbi:MAG TPA: OB-fold domain-containing protein [Mycobacteriales bacterium]|nr:OB-fold domain-containing protein [Mycobacteriales bacterium]